MPPILTMPPRFLMMTPNTVRLSAPPLCFLGPNRCQCLSCTLLSPNRDGSFCLQRRRPRSDGGQRLRRCSVGAELQLPRGGHLYLAARGPPQSHPHQRGRGNPAVPHLHVWRGRPHHTVEIPVSQREETEKQVPVSRLFMIFFLMSFIFIFFFNLRTIALWAHSGSECLQP